MWSYAGAVWRCRYFWLSLVKVDLRARYRGSALGVGWSLLQPLAMALILCTVFHRLFHRDISYYGPYVLAGLAFWNFVLEATLEGCRCFLQARSYMHQYPAPAAIYPLRAALGSGCRLLPTLLIVMLLAGWQLGVRAPLALLGLAPALLLALVLGWSLALLAGLAHAHFRDTKHLLEVGFQVLFYLTPIIYPPDALSGSRFRYLLCWNPLVPFLQMVREPVLDARLPSAATFTAAAVIVLAAAGTAAFFLRRLERQLIYKL